MSVWLVLPSARRVEQCRPVFEAWRDMGYRLAIQRDPDAELPRDAAGWAIGNVFSRRYLGYAESVNYLAAWAMRSDLACDWIVCAGDDTFPDPHKRADEIAEELTEHFHGTFGVCQPTGDPWSDSMGRIIERIAGSPWMGREWCKRAYGGNGPLWAEYTHCFADEELQEVATRLGVFWQRPDITHLHHNWARPIPGQPLPRAGTHPAFLAEANSPEHWRKYSALFRERKAAGFPGSEPL